MRRADAISEGLWTDGAVTLLRKLWAEGLSGSQIAKQLAADGHGSFTRNAVIGKIHRLGLAGRSSPARPVRRPVRAPQRVARPRITPPRQIAAALPVIAVADLEPLLDAAGAPVAPNAESLTAGQCRWPIGDPARASFAFCARPAATVDVARDPYCDCHKRIARVRGTALKDKPRRRGAMA